MIQLTENIWAEELTKLGDIFKKIQILPADNKWTVPYLKYAYRSIYHTNNFKKDFYCGDEIPLEPGQWEYICTSKDATEEQAQDIVECTMPKVRGTKVQIASYKNYEAEFSSFSGALPSLQSLLKSKGLEGNFALLRKNHPALDATTIK
jgi:hypothetical protein